MKTVEFSRKEFGIGGIGSRPTISSPMAAPPRLPNCQTAWRGRHSVERLVGLSRFAAGDFGNIDKLLLLEHKSTHAFMDSCEYFRARLT
jgi:hypothetical protein